MTDVRQNPRPKLRTRQAASYTGISESTLEKLRVYGGGPPYMRVGRIVVYDADDLDAWLATHKRFSTSVEAS
jgi:excisionase family DNA binding protein